MTNRPEILVFSIRGFHQGHIEDGFFKRSKGFKLKIK